MSALALGVRHIIDMRLHEISERRKRGATQGPWRSAVCRTGILDPSCGLTPAAAVPPGALSLRHIVSEMRRGGLPSLPCQTAGCRRCCSACFEATWTEFAQLGRLLKTTTWWSYLASYVVVSVRAMAGMIIYVSPGQHPLSAQTSLRAKRGCPMARQLHWRLRSSTTQHSRAIDQPCLTDPSTSLEI